MSWGGTGGGRGLRARLAEGLRRFGAPLTAGVSLLFCDLLSKDLAATLLLGRGPVELLPGLRLVLRSNPGLSLGLFARLDPSLRQPLVVGLSAVALLALPALVGWLVRSPRLRAWALALLAAGALGNLLERIWAAEVVDFLQLGPVGWRLPTFNLADLAILAGGGLAFWGRLRARSAGARRSGGATEEWTMRSEQLLAPTPAPLAEAALAEVHRPAALDGAWAPAALRGVRRGMTLIEIMVVVTIIAMMATAISISVVKLMGNARVSAAKGDISTMSTALDLYYADQGEYPSQGDGLSALANKGSDGGCYIKDCRLPKDPWKQDYTYRYPGTKNSDGFDLCSRGMDKQEGTEDDICNGDSK